MEHIPQVGEYNIILNGLEEPVCITQTKVVYITSYNLISPEHAWHEGEGDRSYKYWKNIHDIFFMKNIIESVKDFMNKLPCYVKYLKKSIRAIPYLSNSNN